MATEAECTAKGMDFDVANEMCVAKGGGSATTGFQGAVTLTLDQIRTELDLLNSQIAEKYPDATDAERTALQQQAYAEFIEMSQADGGVNVTPTLFAQALNQPYDQDFQNLYYTGIGNKTPLGLGYSQTVTAGTDAWNTWLQDNPDQGVSQSIFGTGTAAKSWVPQAITQADVQAPTDYEQLTAAQMAPYLPTAPYDVTKVSQSTPAYTAATAGLPSTLFDAINFPAPEITRGTPVITRGFDAQGKPNTAITMGQSTADPSGADIGNLTTTAQFPSTGMGIGPTGLGTTTTGTMGTTGNIVSTGADKIVQWVDENGVLQTSSVNPTVLNTGSGTNTGVTVTPAEVDLSTVPGSVAFCEINPTHDSCIPGTAVFCEINPNHDSCQSATTCPDGKELWNGVCVDICQTGYTRDANGICQSNDQGNCPVGTARAGSPIPNGQTQAWCDTTDGDVCPTGSELEGQAVPASGDCNPAATALAAQKVICENAGGTWDDATGCTAATATTKTCELGSQREGEVIAIDGDCNPCGTGYTWNRAQGKCEPSDTTLHCNPGQVKRMDADGNEYCEDKAQCGAYQTYDELNNACITKTAQEVIGDLYLAEEAAIGPNASLAEREAAAGRIGDAIAVYGTATGQEFTSDQLTGWLNPLLGTTGQGYGINIQPDDPNTLIDESKVSEYEASKYLMNNPIAGVTATMDADEIAAWDAYFAGTGALPATTAGQATAGGVDWTGAADADTLVDTSGTVGGTTGTAATGTAATGTATTDTLVDPYATQKAACTAQGRVWDDTNNQCGGVAGTALTGASVTGTGVTGAGGVTDPLAGFSADLSALTEVDVGALVDMINTGQTTVDAVAARYQVAPGDIQSYLDSLTTTGATTTGATTVVDPYATQKATCDTNGGTWDGVNNLCIPAIDTTAITNQVNTQLGGIGGLYPGVGVVGAKTPGGPALPTNLATSLVPGIDSLNFGDGQLINTGGFGFAANTAAGATPGGPYPGTGPGFKYGGEVEGKEGKSNQRQNAVGSRLMRHAGLGQYRDMIPPEMLSSLDRIMDRKG